MYRVMVRYKVGAPEEAGDSLGCKLPLHYPSSSRSPRCACRARHTYSASCEPILRGCLTIVYLQSHSKHVARDSHGESTCTSTVASGRRQPCFTDNYPHAAFAAYPECFAKPGTRVRLQGSRRCSRFERTGLSAITGRDSTGVQVALKHRGCLCLPRHQSC